MTVEFENYGHFYCSLSYTNNDVIECYDGYWPRSLKECAEYLKRNMDNDSHIILGMICDWETGEVVMSFVPDEEDTTEDADWDYNEDMGFDPYLGCYTDDC